MAQFAKSLVAVGVSWMAFKKIVVDSFKEYMKAEDAQTRLGAAIRITGQQATASVNSLARYAKELQGITNYEDEASMAAMGVLMQLGNLTEQGVKKALPLLQDFAAFWGMDLVQAAELFGKTLGSDTNALSRYGIELEKNLTSDQKLVAILGQMKTGMGGFAKEMATTTSGQLKAMTIQVDELKESFGGFLAAMMRSEVVQKALTGLTDSFKTIAWAMEGYKIKLEDVDKMSRAQLINYNTELNNTRLEFEKLIAASQKRMPGLSTQFANREIAQMEKYRAEIRAIEAQMASANRALRGMPAGAAAPALTTGGDITTSPVVVELTEEQKQAQAMTGMWVELRKQAILYQKELQNNRDVAIDAAEAGTYTLDNEAEILERMLTTMEGIGFSTVDIAKTVEKDWSDAFKTIADLTVDIAGTMGEAFASGDILGGLNQVAQKLLSMFTMMAMEAAMSAAIAMNWPMAVFWLGVAGVSAFAGGAMRGASGGGESGVEIPAMAGGGMVTRPTLALIGESGPEAVVPLGRGGAGGTTIIVQGSIWQTEDLARAVAGAMRRW